MLTLLRGDQGDKSITQLITDVFIWPYSVLYIVIACPLPDQKKIIKILQYLSSLLNLNLRNLCNTILGKKIFNTMANFYKKDYSLSKLILKFIIF
jgi:hypothetical protein